jgi:hypothetical protein
MGRMEEILGVPEILCGGMQDWIRRRTMNQPHCWAVERQRNLEKEESERGNGKDMPISQGYPSGRHRR